MKVKKYKRFTLLVLVISALAILTGCKTDEEKYDDLVSEGKSLARDDKTSKAEKKYKEAIELLPEKSAAYLELYKLYIDEEDYVQADAILSEALEQVEERSEKKKIEKKAEEFIEKGYLDVVYKPTSEPIVTDGPDLTGPPIVTDEPDADPGLTDILDPETDYTTLVTPTSEPDITPTIIVIDPNGTPGGYIPEDDVPKDCQDLNGIEIVICDWYSDKEGLGNDYEEARDFQRQVMMERHNYIIKADGSYKKDSIANEFVEYATNGGDDRYLVFVLPNNWVTRAALDSCLAYNLAHIPDILDFSEERYRQNRVYEKYVYDDAIYGFNVGYAEPGTGIYFNKTLLKEAGIDPDTIYDMQKNGTWTWDAFEDILAATQDYLDNSKYVMQHHALSCNKNAMVTAAVVSNGGEYIGRKQDGTYSYRLEDPDTTEALEWAVKILTDYYQYEPEDAADDYYLQEFIDGGAAFLVDNESVSEESFDHKNFEAGFVMFPQGPKAETCVNISEGNIIVIPACYNYDKIRQIAFALSKYFADVQGFEDINEDYIDALHNSLTDYRAGMETLPMMYEPEHRVLVYHNVLADIDIDKDFLRYIYAGADVHLAQMKTREAWQDVKELEVPEVEVPPVTPSPESEYILSDSDKRYIDESELAMLSAWGCKVARNEIYARHGRRFKDAELQAYFDAKSWYKGTIEPADFDDSVLNDFENKNKELITKYEIEKGYRD